ncbi:MAG: diphosphate--fructose-6-phosphate 1-phosphotransferase [Chloroflexota bacterium]
MTPTLLVGQSGGPTPVINASLAGLLEEAVRLGAFPRIAGLRHGIEGALQDDLVPLDHLGPNEWAALARTPAAALGSCRRKLAPDDYDRILDVFRRRDVRWFCYVGGNDSMDTCDRLQDAAAEAGMELAVFGVPKTIDNDLVETDHCPGYGSVARYWAITTQEATLDLAAMQTYDRVVILECMGRNAGWLTASCALHKQDERDGPHVLLTPEHPFDEGAFLAQVEATIGRVGYCVVATSETIRDARGQYVARARGGVDRFGHPIVTAVGETLAQLVTERLRVKARANKPGTFQRTSIAHVSPVDLQEAREAGRQSARHLARGQRGAMVTLQRPDLGAYRCEYGVVALRRVANRERRLPGEYLTADRSGVTPAFLAYARPLLGPAPEPLFWLA